MSIANINANTSITVKDIFFGSEGTPLDSAISVGYTSMLSGAFAGGPTVSGLFRTIGASAILSVNGIAALTDGPGPITFDTPVPVKPYNTVVAPIWVISASTPVLGSCQIDTDGHIVISRSYADTFPAAQNCGFQTFTICYATY